jgi:hypothetical protein
LQLSNVVEKVGTDEENRSRRVHRSVGVYAVSVGIYTDAAIIDAHSDCWSEVSYLWVFAPTVPILRNSFLGRSTCISQLVKGVCSRGHTVHVVGAILAGMGI